MKRLKGFAIATAGLMLVVVPLGAAAQNRGNDPAIRNRTRTQSSDMRAEQTHRETKKLAIGANGSLDLATVSGDITVTSAPGQEATVEIVRVSRGRTDADAKLGLDRVTVTVDQSPNRASVRANYPDDSNRGRSPYQVSVAYTVTAPPGTRLTAENVGGNVRVTGIRGELRAETVGGDVTIANAGQVLAAKTIGGEISINGAQSDGTLEASTVGGSVLVQQAKAKRITISAVGGNVTARDVTCETADLGTMSGTVEFSGPVAKGGRYELRTQSGTVRFLPANDAGYELQARTFSGEIRTDVPLKVQGTVSSRGPQREVRGTVGDGSASVIARTFSGDVIVGKK